MLTTKPEAFIVFANVATKLHVASFFQLYFVSTKVLATILLLIFVFVKKTRIKKYTCTMLKHL